MVSNYRINLSDYFFFQTAMGLLRLGFITIFLSDPLISGFTTGAACWVFTSQIKHIIGIYPRHSGPIALIKVRYKPYETCFIEA